MKKIIVISDTHCGHYMGITPPEYMTQEEPIKTISLDLWCWFCEQLNPSGYDYMLHAGDIIDGAGRKDNTFLLTTDPLKQGKIAKTVIEKIGARKHYFCYGTPYHVSGDSDFESPVAEYFGDKISWLRKLEIEGVKFNLAHTIGKSTSPVGGDIALRKQIVWNYLLDVKESGESADVIIRGHAHEYRALLDADTTAFICPSLKIGNADYDRYGRKMQGGHYHVGFVEIDVDNGKIVRYDPKIYKYNFESKYEVV